MVDILAARQRPGPDGYHRLFPGRNDRGWPARRTLLFALGASLALWAGVIGIPVLVAQLLS